MSLNFEFDEKTKKINRIIKKSFGKKCNCFFCYDTNSKSYRFTFVEIFSDGKPTQVIDQHLNHVFFNNLIGTSIKENTTIEQIKTFCLQNLNYFIDRKDFLLNLIDIFIKEFGMPEIGAINEVHYWQDCILTVYKTKQNKIFLYLYENSLEQIPETNCLYKMTQGLKTNINDNHVKYKILDLDLETLSTTIEMYS